MGQILLTSTSRSRSALMSTSLATTTELSAVSRVEDVLCCVIHREVVGCKYCMQQQEEAMRILVGRLVSGELRRKGVGVSEE